MSRPFKQTSIESHNWDARADLALAQATLLPAGAERDSAMRRVDQLRVAADMRRLLSKALP